MKEDKIDQEIREKLQGRVIQPSASAWERLSSQLDEVEQKKKRHWFLYVGYAASIALIVSLFFFLTQSDDNESDIPENIIVQEEVETPEKDPLKEFKTVPVEDEVIVDNRKLETREMETGRVKNQDTKTQDKLLKKLVPTFKGTKDNAVIAEKKQPKAPEVDVQQTIKKLNQQQEKTAIVNADTPNGNDSLFKKQNPSNSRISVDSDALLMSVTGTREEIVAYYKKYKIDRAEVLATIEKELKKSSLKVDPKTILAEVEQDVNEENFQNNFYQFIKKRVSTVATAIANRNN